MVTFLGHLGSPKSGQKWSGPKVVSADITMANWRRLVPTDLSADLQKMSHIVRCSDVKKYITDQVGLRLCHDQKRPKSDPNGVKPMKYEPR